MNSIHKALLAAGIIAMFNFNAMAEDAASAVPTLQGEVERLKELNPKQLAEKQKALYEAKQKLSSQQFNRQREEMLKELSGMSPEEYKALNDKPQTEEEKLLARERAEHSADPQHEAAASKLIKSEKQRKAAPAKAHPASKRKTRSHSLLP